MIAKTTVTFGDGSIQNLPVSGNKNSVVQVVRIHADGSRVVAFGSNSAAARAPGQDHDKDDANDSFFIKVEAEAAAKAANQPLGTPTNYPITSIEFTFDDGTKEVMAVNGANSAIASITHENADGSVIPVATIPVPTGTVPGNSDLSALKTAQASAQALINANAPEGTPSGQHVVGSLSTLSAALGAVSTTTASTQADVDAQTTKLTAAIAAYEAALVA